MLLSTYCVELCRGDTVKDIEAIPIPPSFRTASSPRRPANSETASELRPFKNSNSSKSGKANINIGIPLTMREAYKKTFHSASGLSKKVIGMPIEAFCILPPLMSQRPSLGKYLEQVRLEGLDLTLREAVKRAAAYRDEIGQNSIRDIEREFTLNPGILTVEAIALGYNLPPLEVIARGLAHRYELNPDYQESRFATIWKRRSKLKPSQKRLFDDYVETLIKRLDEFE